jgi:hypothetical protein
METDAKKAGFTLPLTSAYRTLAEQEKVDLLSSALKRSDSALVAVTTKLEILTEMGAIK